jgi:bifunctional DNA-binding transcriptional regulator/antitoxin component of YhaV-PrlF toxin-antitoxin module/DNA-binding protein YbaB
VEVRAEEPAEVAVDFSSGTLTVHVTANGDTQPARVFLYRAGTKDEVDRDTLGSGGGHYANPESFRLPPGSYDLKVRPKKIAAPEKWRKGLEVEAGRETETAVDFSSGTLTVHVTANGDTEPARVYLYKAGTKDEVDRDTLGSGGGHYANPESFRLPPGSYDLKVRPKRIAAPEKWREGLEVEAGRETETAVDFSAGTLTLHVTAGGQTRPARVYLYQAGTRDEVDRDTLGSGGGHYANPESFRLPPGSYDLKVRPEKIAAPAKWRKGLEVEAGQETETAVDFSSGTLTLHVTAGGETRPSRVYLYRAGTKDEVERDTLGSGGGHYANPESFRLPPGSYDLKVRDKAKELPDAWEKGVEVRAGRETEVSVELAP